MACYLNRDSESELAIFTFCTTFLIPTNYHVLCHRGWSKWKVQYWVGSKVENHGDLIAHGYWSYSVAKFFASLLRFFSRFLKVFLLGRGSAHFSRKHLAPWTFFPFHRRRENKCLRRWQWDLWRQRVSEMYRPLSICQHGQNRKSIPQNTGAAVVP